MREEKEFLKLEVVEKFQQKPSFVVMQYSALSANMATDLRQSVRKSGGNVQVMRKRVLAKAAKDVGVDFDFATLDGHIGVIFLGDDPMEVTKIVCKFSDEQGKSIQVLGGRLEGRSYSAQEVETLSKLPGKDEMRSQFLALLEAPMAQTLSVMEALLTSVAHCLENKRKQLSGEE